MKKNASPHEICRFFFMESRCRSIALLRFALAIFVLLSLPGQVSAQINTHSRWVWMHGSNTLNNPGVYGTQGLPGSVNNPEARYGSATWATIDGTIWVMGGQGIQNNGKMNDLWKWDPITRVWTWVKGSKIALEKGVYGEKNVPSAQNVPGARRHASAWTDKAGNLWMFGGLGLDKHGVTELYLNDLWKYDPLTNAWTWIAGADTVNQAGIFGSRGVPDKHAVPGARASAAAWTDDEGNFWLFGGAALPGRLNDLWRYDMHSGIWTWMHGDSTFQAPSVHGEMGIGSSANKPGARLGSVGCQTPDGNFWVFAGREKGGNVSGTLNELWRYDPSLNEWTWMGGSKDYDPAGTYGAKGKPGKENIPGGRFGAASWVSGDGKIWVFGGLGGFDASKKEMKYNDLWIYDPCNDEWTWVSGDSTANQFGIYQTDSPGSIAQPGSRYYSVSVTDMEGRFWLMQGIGYASNREGLLNDAWCYSPVSNEWEWVGGSQEPNSEGVYGIQGSSAQGSFPGARWGSATWTTPDGRFWLFGGEGYSPFGFGWLSDLWTFGPSSKQWVWVKGPKTNHEHGWYGNPEKPEEKPYPGSRHFAQHWTDREGNIWLMGGYGYGSSNNFGYLNDIWKFNPVTLEWSWLGGSSGINASGVYGIRGMAAPGNHPGGREHAITWVDADGKFWMLGGFGSHATGTGQFNDLWKFDPSAHLWTWVSGDSIPNQHGVYGSLGKKHANNKPGARWGGQGWIDKAGNLWMMGGEGYATQGLGLLNDLWRYDPHKDKWTWVNGDSVTNIAPSFGTQGLPEKSNQPGSRQGAVGWQDREGVFWLMGGNGYGSGARGYLNDLWAYHPLKNTWTWVKGDQRINNTGVYGLTGVPEKTNKPGSREHFMNWTSADGSLWIMGGEGYAEMEFQGRLNDLWVLTNLFYRDADGDGYGDEATAKLAGYAPDGYVLRKGDCNDGNRRIHPGAVELCDGLDNDCDGEVDESCKPVISVGNTSVKEGDHGFRYAVFTIRLRKPVAFPVSLQYETISRTAKANEDFEARFGSLIIPAGSRIKIMHIPVLGDKVPEPDESFRLRLSGAVNAILRDSIGTCFILDDDQHHRKPGHNAVQSTADVTDEVNGTKMPLRVRVLPNPSNSEFTISLTSGNDMPVTLKVSNLSGIIVEARSFNAGTSAIRVGAKWPKGVYILELVQGDQRRVIQLIKIE